jgi:hypothetical protein
VRAGRDEVGVRQRKLAGALRAIGKQQRSSLTDARRKTVQRLDDSGLIVDKLDRD